MWHNNFRMFVGLTTAALVGTPLTAQDQPAVVGFSVSTSSSDAGVTFQMTDGTSLAIRLRGGALRIADEVFGRYAPGGALENQWRAFLDRATGLSTEDMVRATQEWAPSGLSDGDAESAGAMRAAFARLSSLDPVSVSAVTPVPPVPPVPEIAGAAAELAAAAQVLRDQDIAAVVAEAVEVAGSARVIRDELRNSVRARIQNEFGEPSKINVQFDPDDFRTVRVVSPVEAAWQGLLGVLGTFLALVGVAFGASFFAERQLDVVADTVQTSFGRSFLVGLFAQPLILPVFAAMIVALALTVVGILVIPVAVVAFLTALAAAVIGGYLAVARVAGAKFLSRKNRDYGTEALGILRSVAYGVAILLAIWLPAALLGSAPVAGALLKWTAIASTWGLATTGFGAAILTRGGLRGTFGRRFAPASIAPDHLFAPSAEIMDSKVDTAEWLAEGAPK